MAKKMEDLFEHYAECFLEQCENGDLDKVKYWISSRGMDIHLYNDNPLRTAAWKCHLDVVKYLLCAGADATKICPETMQRAYDHGSLDMLTLLAKNGAPVGFLNSDARRYLSARLQMQKCVCTE